MKLLNYLKRANPLEASSLFKFSVVKMILKKFIKKLFLNLNQKSRKKVIRIKYCQMRKEEEREATKRLRLNL